MDFKDKTNVLEYQQAFDKVKDLDISILVNNVGVMYPGSILE